MDASKGAHAHAEYWQNSCSSQIDCGFCSSCLFLREGSNLALPCQLLRNVRSHVIRRGSGTELGIRTFWLYISCIVILNMVLRFRSWRCEIPFFPCEAMYGRPFLSPGKPFSSWIVSYLNARVKWMLQRVLMSMRNTGRIAVFPKLILDFAVAAFFSEKVAT